MIDRCIDCGHQACKCGSSLQRKAVKILAAVLVVLSAFTAGVILCSGAFMFAESRQYEAANQSAVVEPDFDSNVECEIRDDLVNLGCIRVVMPTNTLEGVDRFKEGIESF